MAVQEVRHVPELLLFLLDQMLSSAQQNMLLTIQNGVISMHQYQVDNMTLKIKNKKYNIFNIVLKLILQQAVAYPGIYKGGKIQFITIFFLFGLHHKYSLFYNQRITYHKVLNRRQKLGMYKINAQLIQQIIVEYLVLKYVLLNQYL